MSAEQQARDMLERLGHPNAQSMAAGDLVELANLIHECERLRQSLAEQTRLTDRMRLAPPHPLPWFCKKCGVARPRGVRSIEDFSP